MSFFYKYVDLTGQDDETLNGNSPYVGGKPHDESSPLIVKSGGELDDPKQTYTSTPNYVTESEGELDWDKSGEATKSQSEF